MTTIEYTDPDASTNASTKIQDLEDYAAQKQMSLQEALSKYQIVGANHDPANGSYVILADQTNNLDPSYASQELGYASPSPWTAWTREERVPELRDKIGLRTYYDMKRADATVRGALRLLKTPIQAARWFIEPFDDTPLSKSIADFVEENLFNYLYCPWSQFIEDALLMCDYGYMAFEKVWVLPNSDQDKVKDGKLRLGKLAPRHPMDIREWLWDANGGPDAFVMENISIQGTGNYGSTFASTNIHASIRGNDNIPNAAQTGNFNQANYNQFNTVGSYDQSTEPIPIAKAMYFP